MSLEVTWRSGAKSVVRNVPPNYVYELFEIEAKGPENVSSKRESNSPTSNPKREAPWFEDLSRSIEHTHSEPGFDDFAVQPLLPKKLSQLGPAVAWFDLDGDADDDLIVGAGKGGSLALFRNDGGGRFSRWEFPALARPLPDDSSGIIGWSSGGGRRSLLVAVSSYESVSAPAPSVSRFDSSGGTWSDEEPIPRSPSSPGPMALADLDGDGDVDLFVGGRVIPGRYPEAASSFIYRNAGSGFELDAENSALLEGLGLVTGAVFSDLNGDGQPDLALACEWGPIRVFQNSRGMLRDATSEWGFGSQTGLWTSITTGDFDADGRMDIVAGNWGLNGFYNQTPFGPWHLYFGDINGDGQIQILEAYTNSEMNKIVPWRDMQLLETAFPWIRETSPTHKAYGRSGVSEILGDRASRASELRATNLQSMVFLNRDGRFEAAPLPVEAQWAPVFGLSVGDLDGDGNQDLFLAQNCFAVRTEDHRLDAGRGLLLRGDGEGGFSAVKGHESGIEIYGEQRGCAVSDFDQDGRLDLAVAQNGAATRLYRNTRAKPGLRIRLVGPNENPDAIGARVRLRFGERLGPAVEVHAGSGYWSQDSFTLVMGTPEIPTGVWVSWPGGKITETPILQNAREIQVRMR